MLRLLPLERVRSYKKWHTNIDTVIQIDDILAFGALVLIPPDTLHGYTSYHMEIPRIMLVCLVLSF